MPDLGELVGRYLWHEAVSHYDEFGPWVKPQDTSDQTLSSFNKFGTFKHHYLTIYLVHVYLSIKQQLYFAKFLSKYPF